MPPTTIAVIGSLNTDLVTRTPRIPDAGETLAATSFATGFGGKGANQALACQRLSHCRPAAASASASTSTSTSTPAPTSASRPVPPPVHVTMHGAVGADAFGPPLRASLADSGVDVSGVRTLAAPSRTGVANVLVDAATGQNRILLAAGANALVAADWFPTALPGAPQPDLLVLQLEIPLPTVLHVLRLANAAGARVLLNPAPAVALPDEAYALVDTLVLNESEATLLLRRGDGDADADAPPAVPEDATEAQLAAACAALLRRGVRAVVLTLGARGAYFAVRRAAGSAAYADADASASASASGLVPPPTDARVAVVDTTAAGDTFIGAYAVRLAREGAAMDVRVAVAWANRCASVAVGREGAQASIPWLDELDVGVDA